MDKPLEVIVKVEQGKLRGKTGTNYFGDTIYKFQGIPYADPPNRFQLAKPPSCWTGIKDATQENAGCYCRDILTGQVTGSEDCLYLNVYTKTILGSALRPVMVWIHGGAFVTGSNKTDLYGPEFLLTEDIVLVTINYRVGIIGFLNFEDVSLPTTRNLGLKDQRLALEWIQKNIETFGGDPNNVTLFGESAGASSVHYHVLSRGSEGLFHKAIMQSGSALSVLGQSDINLLKVVEAMGYEAKTEKDAFDILTKVPMNEILEAQETHGKFAKPDTRRLVGPTVEHSDTPAAIITEAAIDLITTGNYTHVPCIFGYNANEGITIEQTPQIKPDMKPGWNCQDMIPFLMEIDKGSHLELKIGRMIKEKYFSQGGDDNSNLLDLFSDNMFAMWVIASIKQHTKTSMYPVYAYKMTIETDLNLKNQIGRIKIPGVSHADDLGYLFKTKLTPTIEKDSIQEVSWQRFVKMWSNFAKYGNPTPNKNELGVIWEPVENSEQIKTLLIGKELEMRTNPDQDRVEFWRNVLEHSPKTRAYMKP